MEDLKKLFIAGFNVDFGFKVAKEANNLEIVGSDIQRGLVQISSIINNEGQFFARPVYSTRNVYNNFERNQICQNKNGAETDFSWKLIGLVFHREVLRSKIFDYEEALKSKEKILKFNQSTITSLENLSSENLPKMHSKLSQLNELIDKFNFLNPVDDETYQYSIDSSRFNLVD